MSKTAGFFMTTDDFALSTYEVDVAESGPNVRRIGLNAPWQDLKAWRVLVRAALGDLQPSHIPVRVARPRAA